MATDRVPQFDEVWTFGRTHRRRIASAVIDGNVVVEYLENPADSGQRFGVQSVSYVQSNYDPPAPPSPITEPRPVYLTTLGHLTTNPQWAAEGLGNHTLTIYPPDSYVIDPCHPPKTAWGYWVAS